MLPNRTDRLGSTRAATFPYASVLVAGSVSLLAGLLRFSSLDAGLRHEPHSDEQVFVEEVHWMIRREDWAPRFFEYPGLLFWILRPLFTLTEATGPDSYLWARSFIAAVSTATVFLVAYVGSRWFSPPIGALCGLLLAVSPVCVHTAHWVRPDSMIHGLVLLALVTAVPLSGRPRYAVGWCLGAVAVATKFSAVLVFPALLLGAFVDRLPMIRIARLALLAFGTFCALSPWTFLAGTESMKGMAGQVAYHYSNDSELLLPSLGHHITYTLPLAFSWPGIGLVIVGLLVLARHPRGLIWVSFVVLWVLVFSSTHVPFIRFMVPLLGVLSLAAGAGFDELFRRGHPLARAAICVWALVALASSAGVVVRYLTEIGRPSTKDRALDWIEASPGLARVASTELGLGRFSETAAEIVGLMEGDAKDDLLLRQFDALVLSADSPIPSGFLEAARFRPESAAEGHELVLFAPRTPPKVAAEPLNGAILTSSAPDRQSKLLDKVLNTRWRADSLPAFIEVTLPAPANLARVELQYGAVSRGKDQIARLFVDGRQVRFVRVRGPVQRQRRDRESSELLGFDTPAAQSLRIEFGGEPPFIVSELRLYSHPSSPSEPGGGQASNVVPAPGRTTRR